MKLEVNIERKYLAQLLLALAFILILTSITLVVAHHGSGGITKAHNSRQITGIEVCDEGIEVLTHDHGGLNGLAAVRCVTDQVALGGVASLTEGTGIDLTPINIITTGKVAIDKSQIVTAISASQGLTFNTLTRTLSTDNSISTSLQARVDSCLAGQAIKSIDHLGNVVCEDVEAPTCIWANAVYGLGAICRGSTGSGSKLVYRCAASFTGPPGWVVMGPWTGTGSYAKSDPGRCSD